MNYNIKQRFDGILQKFITFAGVGVINTIVDFVIYSLLYSVLHYEASISHAAGYTVGTINSYILNKHITFKGGTKQKRYEIIRFVFTNVLSLALSTFAIWSLTDVYGVNGYVAKIFAIIVTQGVNFTMYSLWVFKEK